MTERKASAAGRFYPGSKQSLEKKIENSFMDKEFGPGKLPETQSKEKRKIIGGTAPHAGYDYSGSAAAHTYLHLFKERIPDTVIILGTDHVGYGKIALMEEGSWETPLGDLKIDSELAKAMLNNSETIISDDSAFTGFRLSQEHNIEVQLPFIKYCAQNKDVKIVPIKISNKNFQTFKKISQDISHAINSLEKDIIIVASSDMTHKQPRNPHNPSDDLEKMRENDEAVMNAFEKMDPKLVYEKATNTSVCGPQTITTLLMICQQLGANQAKSLRYYTSYEKLGGSGPCDYSVGYFSGIISRE
jgi:AmmeMemoRadiSam system protein B